MPGPIGYLLTWTCYGTRLHGDPRGTVDLDHNRYGTPMLGPDGRRVVRESRALKNPPVVLDEAMRVIVHETIAAHAHIRGWRIDHHNVRTNHVHVVGSVGVLEPGAAVGQYKAWCTRRLREAGLAGPTQHVWTRRGSKRYLWTELHLAAAISYVRDGQGEDLLPPEMFMDA